MAKINLSNGMQISIYDISQHFPFMMDQIKLNEKDLELIVEGVEACLMDSNFDHYSFSGLLNSLAKNIPSVISKLLQTYTERYFDLDEWRLKDILKPLKLLERIHDLGEDIIFHLLKAIQAADVIGSQSAFAILSTIRRITKLSNLKEESKSKIFDFIWKQIEAGKIPQTATLLTLFEFYHQYYPNRIINQMIEELTSSSAVERKQTHNLISKCIECDSPILNKIMSQNIWKLYLSVSLVLEENQQHIIKSNLAEFVTVVENENCPSEWGLTLYKRAFTHENKKVTRIFCFLALDRIKNLDESNPIHLSFILESLIPMVSNMFLYDIVSDKATENERPQMKNLLETFVQNNPKILSEIFIGLSTKFQSPSPLFYWISALEEKWVYVPKKSNGKIYTAIQELVTRILKTHPLQIRSAVQSLVIKILIKTDAEIGNDDKTPFFKTLSKLSLSSKSDTKNIWGELVQYTNSMNINEEWETSKLNYHMNKTEIKQLALETIFLKKKFPFRFVQSCFDNLEEGSLTRLRNSVLLTSEYLQYIEFENSEEKIEFDRDFVISYFEFIFKVFKNWNRVNEVFEESFIAEACVNICKSFYPILPPQMQKLSREKIWELILVSISDPEPNFGLIKFSFDFAAFIMEWEKVSKIEQFQKLTEEYLSGKCSISGILESAWKCFSILQNRYEISLPEDFLSWCIESFEKCDINGQKTIFECAHSHIIHGGEIKQFSSLASVGWQAVKAAFHCRAAHGLYHYFIKFMINHVTVNDRKFEDDILRIHGEIVEKSQTRHGMLLPAILAYAENTDKDVKIPKILVSGLLAGTGYNTAVNTEILTKDIAMKMVYSRNIDIAHEDQYIIEIRSEMEKVRTKALEAISKLSNSGKMEIVNILLDLTEKENEKFPRYHFESATHKTKERAWQSVLFLLTLIDIKDEKTIFAKYFHRTLKQLNPDEQPSVSILQETVLVLFLVKNKDLWSVCHEIIEDVNHCGFGGSVSGVLMVGLLFGIASKDVDFFLLFLSQCLRLQQSNNFLIRIHSIACIKASYDWSESEIQIKNAILEKFPFMDKHVQFAQAQKSAGNMGRNVDRIMDNIFFAKYDFTKHLSFSGIFRYLPLSAGGLPAGLLSVSSLEALYQKLRENESLNVISFAAKFDDESVKKRVDGEEKEIINFENLKVKDSLTGTQQKITPWMQEKDEKKSDDGIVICASLIEKAHNLGGITRTAEIFGAKKLAFNSLNVLKDKNYTALAVTAMKWIEIEEVKSANIIPWLEKMKSEGYCILGLEQTTNSVNIDKFEFPSKCVLVLGNEKEGIPFDIIAHLDVVLEIPQEGIIRSLNVHVSAAIAIWEFARGNL